MNDIIHTVGSSSILVFIAVLVLSSPFTLSLLYLERREYRKMLQDRDSELILLQDEADDLYAVGDITGAESKDEISWQISEIFFGSSGGNTLEKRWEFLEGRWLARTCPPGSGDDCALFILRHLRGGRLLSSSHLGSVVGQFHYPGSARTRSIWDTVQATLGAPPV